MPDHETQKRHGVSDSPRPDPQPKMGLSIYSCSQDVDIFLVMQGDFQPRDASPEHRASSDTAQHNANWVRVSFGSMPEGSGLPST
jgi:hypothetical protein